MSNPNFEMMTKINPPQNLKCPRCDSEDTKFSYFNNKKTSQPRYFCKNCKRYWTHGGKVRDIPSNGGERRVKRARISSPSTISSASPPPLALSMTYALQPAPYALGRNYSIQPNQQIFQVSYGQGFPAQLKQHIPLGIAWGNQYFLTSTHAGQYMAPNNAHTFRNNNNSMGGSMVGPSYSFPASHYVVPNNTHTFWNNNLMSGCTGGPSYPSYGSRFSWSPI